MNTAEARAQVLESFDPATGAYSHVLPRAWTNFIDGMAWTSVLWAAALKVNDHEIAEACERFNKTLLAVGPDARNYAPVKVDDDWEPSPSFPNLWFIRKPQEFAGPAGLEYARKCGARIDSPFDPVNKARLLVATVGMFGWLSKRFVSLRQHLNSVWTAHLLLGKKPASSLLWSAEQNPYFSFIASKKLTVEYPPMKRTVAGTEMTEKTVVLLVNAEPSAWVFRRDPFKRYVPMGELKTEAYTPVAQLVGDWLQSTL